MSGFSVTYCRWSTAATAIEPSRSRTQKKQRVLRSQVSEHIVSNQFLLLVLLLLLSWIAQLMQNQNRKSTAYKKHIHTHIKTEKIKAITLKLYRIGCTIRTVSSRIASALQQRFLYDKCSNNSVKSRLKTYQFPSVSDNIADICTAEAYSNIARRVKAWSERPTQLNWTELTQLLLLLLLVSARV